MNDNDGDRRNAYAASMGETHGDSLQHPVAWAWVRFVGDGKLDRDHIVLEGMLGQALSEPVHDGSRGTYTHIKPIGARSGFGYPNDWFEVLSVTPTDEVIEASRRLYAERAREIQARRGWMGLVQVGRRIVDEKSARRELEMQCTRIVSLAQDGRYREVRGTLRRINRVLDAFGLHPCGASAIELARHVQEQRHDIVQAPALAARVWRWIWMSRDAEIPLVTGLLKRPPQPWETSAGDADEWPYRHTKRCPNCGFAYNMLGEFAAVIPDKRRIIGGPNPMSRMQCPVCAHIFRVKDGRRNAILAELLDLSPADRDDPVSEGNEGESEG